MANIITNVRGTHDIIGKEANAFIAVENLMRQISELYGFHEVRPPVLESTDLFVRGVGDSSDVVRKEMYTFEDKGGRSVTMRPEFTAGIMRLLVQNKMLFDVELPVKTYYLGPVFRYERPSLGRYRQFNQFGVESVGHDSPLNDVEVITLAYTILQSLGLENVTIKINTLGDKESRNNYREALKAFFAQYIDSMCEDCKSRYELNPLRILDCKVPSDQEIVKNAPKMSEYLTETSKKRFATVCDALEKLGIPYDVDDTLVRGLDYYSDTVFEFHYTSSKGNNYGAIGAGGHYSDLVNQVGGPNLPGIGFSFGVERLVSVLTDDGILGEQIENSCDFYVMPMGEVAKIPATLIATELRLGGYVTEMCFDNTKLPNMFKRAEKKKAKYGVILGENEINNGIVIVKDLNSKEQFEVKREELLETAIGLIEGEKDNCDCSCGGNCSCNGNCSCKKEEE